MSAMDRAIAAVSPKWAMRRELARVQLKQVQRIGEGVKTRRASDAWRINDLSTRRHDAQQGKPMSRYDRAMIREIFDLNPFAAKLLNALLNNLIGYGITATIKNDEKASAAWKIWENACDYDGVLDLYGLQELIASTFLVEGEVFIVLHPEANISGVPLQLQVLDADMLDSTVALANTRIRDGVEYGEHGRPVAYYFKRSRELGGFGDPIRVEAGRVIHLFKRKRPGIWRGRSHFEPVLDVLEDVDGYLEAEGVRKKIAACFVGFRALDKEADNPAMGEVEDQGDGEPPIESFYPGTIINGRQGETMEFGNPPADPGIAEYMKWGGLRIAAGGSATYEHVTGDLSNVNYTSHRAGGLEFQRFVGRTQWLTLLPQCLHRIAAAWSDAALQVGKIDSPAVIKWTPPPFGSVDPIKDIKAKREEVGAGVESIRNVAAERGYDLDELSDEIAADNKMLEEKGLGSLVAGMFARPGGQSAQASAE